MMKFIQNYRSKLLKLLNTIKFIHKEKEYDRQQRTFEEQLLEVSKLNENLLRMKAQSANEQKLLKKLQTMREKTGKIMN